MNLLPNIPNDDNDDKEEEKDEMFLNECCESAINFIKDIFISQNKQIYKEVSCHVVCATDFDSVQLSYFYILDVLIFHNCVINRKLFWDIQNIAINTNLRRGPLG